MPTPSPGLKRVPRWRTMISPPVTVWPANTFTPSRLALESRPLRDDPRPFLCAIGGLLSFRGGLRPLAPAAGGQRDPRHPEPCPPLAVAGPGLLAALQP